MSEREAELQLERRGAVLEITLDRPKVNAIDYELSRKINDAVVKLRDDPELRVGLLTAAGDRVFSAGWDLKAVNRGEQQLDEWWEADSDLPGGFAGLTEMWDLNKPVIAAVNGWRSVVDLNLLWPAILLLRRSTLSSLCQKCRLGSCRMRVQFSVCRGAFHITLPWKCCC